MLVFINIDIIKINDKILERNTEALKIFKAVDQAKNEKYRFIYYAEYFIFIV